MKKWIIAILAAALLTGCTKAPAERPRETPDTGRSTVQSVIGSAPESESFAEIGSGQADSAASKEEPLQDESAEEENSTESCFEPVQESNPEPATQSESTADPVPESVPAPAPITKTDTAAESAPESEPVPEPESVPEPAPEPAPEHVLEPEPAQPSLAYGEIPFYLAAGTEEWWGIDARDSAYQACLDQINAMRAAGGAAALSINADLSAAADARCQSFVAGGPFDHSGMTTISEICAKGPIRSAQEVCAAWQASEVHYNNIMNPNFTQMGVGCWFCSTAQGDYTYWTVTFG